MNALLILLAVIAAAPPASMPERKPNSVKAEAPGLMKLDLVWQDMERVPDPGNPGEKLLLPVRLVGYMVLGKDFDPDRFVLRVDGADLGKFALESDPPASEWGFHAFEIEMPEGDAIIEIKAYAKGEEQPQYQGRFETEIWRPKPFGRGLARDATTFSIDDVPGELQDEGPPEFRRQER